MRASIIARHYAETLFALAERHGGAATVDEYGDALDLLVALLDSDSRVKRFVESPLVDVAAKKQALRGALSGRVPELFLRFLLVVVEKRRAAFLREIRLAYQAMVDEARGRVRADVALAREADAPLRAEIVDSLQTLFGREVLADFRVDRELVGGLVVRVGDQIIDGSIRRRADEMRRRLLAVRLGNGARA